MAIDGKQLDPVALLETLNKLGGEHGIGRVDLVENRFVGMKSRGVYETPGVTILQAAHRALESITLDREVMHLRDSLGVKFAESIYYGFWFAPEFKLMRKMIDETQATVTGDVRLKLFRGNAIVVGRRSPNSLYDEKVATFEADTVYNQRDAEGFIKLNALRLQVRRWTDDTTDQSTSLTSTRSDRQRRRWVWRRLSRSCPRLKSTKAGDVVVVRALTDSATYNMLELPTGRLAKINPGDLLIGVLGRRRALKGFVGDVPPTLKERRSTSPAEHGRSDRLLHRTSFESRRCDQVEVIGLVCDEAGTRAEHR